MNQHCSVCIRECENGHSFCQRRDENGFIKQANRFCAVAIDHLYDKPITHFRDNPKILSIGSWGCNFRCLGCQNFRLSCSVTGDNPGSREIEPDEIVNHALQNKCEGICYTFNEPAILPEVVKRIADLARVKGMFNVFVTNSTLTEDSVKSISGYIDAVAADIKSMKDDFYYEYCGAAGITNVSGKILRCIKAFYDNRCHVEVRTNIIPGANDQENNFREIASWIRDNLGANTPWHITRFFPAYKLSHIGQTPAGTMVKAQQIGLDSGLKYVRTFLEKGCDCAKDPDLIRIDERQEIPDCCKNK